MLKCMTHIGQAHSCRKPSALCCDSSAVSMALLHVCETALAILHRFSASNASAVLNQWNVPLEWNGGME